MSAIKDPKKFAYIDALRGIAILGVLMVHCGQYGNNNYSHLLQSVVSHGKYGVQLFFIVSALTLFMSMKERSVHEKYPVLNFFIRRFFRIAPLFYITVLYYLVADALGQTDKVFGTQGISGLDILATASFTNGINPYWINSIVPGGWTIAVEMTFYLILPFLYKNVKSLKSALLLPPIALVGTQVLDIILHKHILIPDAGLWEVYLYVYFPSQLPVFLLGILLFYLIKNQQNAAPADKNQGLSFEMTWIIIAMLLMAQIILKDAIPIHILCSIVFVFLAYSLSLRPTKLFVNKFTVFIGKISFSLYLTQFIALHYMDKFHLVDFLSNQILNFGIRYIVLLAAAGSLSFMTYSLIEKPGQGLGKRLIKMINK